MGLAIGLTLDPAEPLAADVTRFGISTVAAAAAAALYALACYAPPRGLVAAALAGGVGWAAYGALTSVAHVGTVVATGLAAVVVGLASELSGGRSVHRLVVVLSGITPLLPGLTAYRGFYQLASGQAQDVVDGLVTVTLALAVALALAAGVTLGRFLAVGARPRVSRRSGPSPSAPTPG